MTIGNLSDPAIFEAEVRRVAGALWPSPRYSGPSIVDGRERDAIFITEDMIHYVEATTSNEQSKTKKDLEKVRDLVERLRKENPDKAVKGYFVTLRDPTGHQGNLIKLHSSTVQHYTYHRFLARLVDSAKYLECRRQAPFGSARNPEDDSPQIPANEYVPGPVFLKDDARPKHHTDISRSVSSGKKRMVIQGEFGAGKSMLMRQLFFDLERQHLKSRSHRFPVLINLREHREQTDPAEALTRHARNIGYENPSHVVRAWRAGYIDLLLDGFDELPPRTTQRDQRRVRDIRRQALELIRRFISESRADISIVIAGRSSFFNEENELADALGLSASATFFELSDFDADQLHAYLQRKGFNGKMPDWLPRRPLLLSYLISQKFLGDKDELANDDAAQGWAALARNIYNREASQMEVGVSGEELLRVASRIATRGRSRQSRLGPVTFDDARKSFIEVMRYEPEERALHALLRLPGLRRPETLLGGTPADNNNDNSNRMFIDDDYLNVIAGLDFLEFLKNPFTYPIAALEPVQHPLTPLGIDVCVSQLGESEQHLSAPAKKLGDHSELVANLDFLNLLKESDIDCSTIMHAHNVIADEIEFDGGLASLKRFTLKDCYFKRLTISAGPIQNLPHFLDCYFERVQSVFSQEELESNLMGCEIDDFAHLDRAAVSVMEKLPMPVVVLLDLIEKLYFQSRNGRRDSALPRGLSHQEAELVPYLLDLMRKHQAVTRTTRRGNLIWHPVKSFVAEAERIRRLPAKTTHELVQEAWEFQV